jgi:hypothetical protein
MTQKERDTETMRPKAKAWLEAHGLEVNQYTVEVTAAMMADCYEGGWNDHASLVAGLCA